MIIGQFIFKFEYERIQNRARPTEIISLNHINYGSYDIDHREK